MKIWTKTKVSINLTISGCVRLILILSTYIISISMNIQNHHPETLQTVPFVDINKYSGKWYEIASYPNRFQRGCNCTTAEYTMTTSGYLKVENRCNLESTTGPSSYIKGKATVVKNSGNSKLKVQFFWPFKAKYWIIDLAADYSYAVVSNPSRKYLWVLSRTPIMDDAIYNQILSRIHEKGFDLKKLKRTVQVK